MMKKRLLWLQLIVVILQHASRIYFPFITRMPHLDDVMIACNVYSQLSLIQHSEIRNSHFPA